MNIPKKVLQFLRHAVLFDSICVAFAVLGTALAVIRFVGNLSFPVGIAAPWGIALVLLSIIIIVHLCVYVPLLHEVADDDDGAAFGASVIVVIACIIIAAVQFFHHAFGWLSVESLVLLIVLLVADAFVGVPCILEALAHVEEAPEQHEHQEQKGSNQCSTN